MLLILNSISPETAIIIKNIFSKVINLDSSLITGTLAYVSKFILGLFFYNKGTQVIDEVKKTLIVISEESKVNSEEVIPASLLPF